jgi:hypothetical protein
MHNHKKNQRNREGEREMKAVKKRSKEQYEV